MINQELLNYIKQMLDGGEVKENIKNSLLSAGWQEKDVEEGFNLIIPSSRIEPPSPMPQPKTISEPLKRDITTSTGSRILSGRDFKKIWIVAGIIIAFVLIASGLTYAYVKKIGPFSSAKYTEENFFSNLLIKASQIKSLSYTVSGSLETAPRDKGAEPFELKEVSNSAELKQKYNNDSIRLKNASSIIYKLNNLSGYRSYSPQNTLTKLYPSSIETLFTPQEIVNNNYSIKDPSTNYNYEYQVTDEGKNFLLTISLETDYAIKAITDSYGYKATSTFINNKKVSFTRDSYSPYMSSEMPKPFLITLSELTSQLPADIKANSSISASTEIKSEGMADWSFNINAEGDFSDLTYKINADVLKKNNDYYFKINNFPNIFIFNEINSVKGKWVSISSDSATTSSDDNYSIFSSLEEGLPIMEKNYKENQENFVNLLKKAATIADEEKLIIFKNKPRKEKLDGRQLIRYDLNLKKEAILPFYTRLQEEINNNPDFSEFRSMIDQGLLDYLKSEEFDQVFAYIDSNYDFVFWTDTKGFPAIIQNSMRVVPPDTAKHLEDKQINIISKIIISDINKPLNIEVPSGAMPINEFFGTADVLGLESARTKARDAKRQSDIRQISVAMEMAYEDNGGRYVTSKTGKITTLPVPVTNYLPILPTDPLTKEGYNWIDNTKDSSRYCIYAVLETDPVTYFVASKKGTKTLSIVPKTITDCE